MEWAIGINTRGLFLFGADETGYDWSHGPFSDSFILHFHILAAVCFLVSLVYFQVCMFLICLFPSDFHSGFS